MGNPGVAAVVVNKDTGVYFLQHIDCDQNWWYLPILFGWHLAWSIESKQIWAGMMSSLKHMSPWEMTNFSIWFNLSRINWWPTNKPTEYKRLRIQNITATNHGVSTKKRNPNPIEQIKQNQKLRNGLIK
jgi:hypothetical protein